MNKIFYDTVVRIIKDIKNIEADLTAIVERHIETHWYLDDQFDVSLEEKKEIILKEYLNLTIYHSSGVLSQYITFKSEKLTPSQREDRKKIVINNFNLRFFDSTFMDAIEVQIEKLKIHIENEENQFWKKNKVLAANQLIMKVCDVYDYTKKIEPIDQILKSHSYDSKDEIPKTLITKDVDKLRLVLLSGIYDALFTKLQTTNNATKEQVVRILIDLGITESKDVKSISSSLGKLIKGDTKKETSQIISKLRNMKLIE